MRGSGTYSATAYGEPTMSSGFHPGSAPLSEHAIAGFREGDLARRFAAAPYPHQPYNVESEFRESVPLVVWDRVERDRAARPRGKLFEPCPGIDFVEMGIRSQFDDRELGAIVPGAGMASSSSLSSGSQAC